MDNLKFIEASKRERFALKQFTQTYNLFDEKNNWSLYITPDGGYDVYDALVQHYEKESYICDKRYIIETKIRNVSPSVLIDCKSDGWILESKKLNSLLKIAELDPEKNEILYISFNNDQTLVFNLTKLLAEGLLVKSKRVMNQATMRSTSDKINKSIYLLQEEWASSYKYTFDERSYLSNLNKEAELKSKRDGDVKVSACIFAKLTK